MVEGADIDARDMLVSQAEFNNILLKALQSSVNDIIIVTSVPASDSAY